MREYLNESGSCELVLECVYDANDLERDVYRVLVESEDPLTVDEVGERVDRGRSTAYRTVQRLQRVGIVQKDQMTLSGGGYTHVYRPTDPDRVADEMQRALNDWYAQLGQLIQEFRGKYGSNVPTDRDAASGP